MVCTLEELSNGKIVLLDSSFLNPGGENPLTEQLYTGVNGLNSLQYSIFNRKLEAITRVEQLLTFSDIAVISEVIEETKEQLRILNNQNRYLKDIERLYKEKNERYNQGRPWKKGGRKKQKKFKQKEFWNEESAANLKILNMFEKKLHTIIRKISNKDPRSKFNSEQNRTYKGLFSIANCKPKRQMKFYERKKISELKNPLRIGDDLCTDQKITATGFTLAYNLPVLILTKDIDIYRLSCYIAKTLKKPNSNTHHYIKTTPKENITIFGGYETGKPDTEQNRIFEIDFNHNN